MPEINGFTVRYSDGVKTADYAPPRLVDLTANVTIGPDDDADLALDLVLRLLRRHADHVIHGKALAVPTLSPAAAAAAAAATAGVNLLAAAPKGRKKAAPVAEPADDAIDLSSALGEDTEPEVDADEPEVPAITDADLNSASSKRVGIVGAAAVKKLIWTFKPEDATSFALNMIPGDRRADYLEQLEALQKDG